MKYFPVYIDLENAPALVVGGGEEAAQKLRLLLKTDAKIKVIAHDINDEIKALHEQGRITFQKGSFHQEPLDGYRLIYASSGCTMCDKELSEKARALNINVNIVDQPDQCSFITPAIVDRSPITVAIGTEGVAPVLAREIKTKLEAMLPTSYGRLGEVARRFRSRVQQTITDGKAKRRFWEALFKGEYRKSILDGREDEAIKSLEEALDNGGDLERSVGRVALVGGGPGEPDLITLKAQQRLQTADVVVVDRLVNPAILEYARRDAERIYVGKKAGNPSIKQEEINQILLREALAGKNVVRLKGGDPFIFGRAAEEMVALQSAGIPIEIVPGITAAQACAASIGLPLTSRGHNRKFIVMTGATADDIATKDWLPNVAQGEAAAIYMGVRTAPLIKSRLLGSGLSGRTNIVIVEKGSREDERVVQTHLGALDTCISATGIKGPAIIFVGLDWEASGLRRPDNIEIFDVKNVVQLSSHRSNASVEEN